ncbi:MAG: F0F1 ATP synthase subunit delta [Alphaproteobacteria bacterium]|nr:F0F1 ATP synthase subunit delta [Alphaproteobacteria bacterium]
MAAEDISGSGLAQRYALALFDLARDANAVDAVSRDLQAIRAAIAQSRELSLLISSAIYSRAQQGAAMEAILARMNVTLLTRQFVLFTATQRRLFALPAIAQSFARMVAKSRGEMSAQVKSAHALSDAQVAALRATLKSAYGRDVSLELSVDPSLIGGLIVNVGSRMIDSSLKTKLANLAVAMKGA